MKLELAVVLSLSFLAESCAFLGTQFLSLKMVPTCSKDAIREKRRSYWRSCSCSSSLINISGVRSEQTQLRPLGTKPGNHSNRRRQGSSVVGASMESGDGSEGGDVQQKPDISRGAKLVISVLIDLVGMSSYTVPGLGEISDLGWAPISSALVFYLYGSNVFAGLAFVEEVVPGLDFIPTATLAWFLTNSEVGQNVSSVAGGKGKSSGNTSSASASESASSSRSQTASSASSGGKGGGTVGGRANGDIGRNAVGGEVIDVEAVEP